MKRIYSFITSMSFMAFLLLALAFSMAIATFVESSYGTPAARALIYNSYWFEFLWALFALNLVNNIIKYKLYNVKRYTLGIFHFSFLVILLGAFITRHFSYEGMMHIRENESADSMLSSKSYFYAGINGKKKHKAVRFSELTPKQFSADFSLDGKEVKVKSVGYISGAERKPVPSATGESMIDLVFSSEDLKGMQSFIFSKGDIMEESGISLSFESEDKTGVTFFTEKGELYMTSDSLISGSTMTSRESTLYRPGDTIAVRKMFLYSIRNFRFLVRNYYPNAEYTAVKSSLNTNEDAVFIQITGEQGKQTVPVFGHSGIAPDTLEVTVDGSKLKLAYGAREISLPFRVYLVNFNYERYPGSDSPSSYSSEIKITDKEKDDEHFETISMNNPLLYKGYKFFQSSYDEDEKGTILSVNHDYWGTVITYFGYAMLVLGIVFSLLNRYSYFRKLIRKLKEPAIGTITVIVLICGISFNSTAQGGASAGIPGIDKRVIKKFSELWVQGVDGRIEPVSTLNSEIIRKISRKSSLYGMSPDKVVLSMMAYPEIWRTLPIIRVSNKTLISEFGIRGKYISVRQLFNDEGNYRIAEDVRAAYSKIPAFRSRVEKEYIYLDERISICFMVFNRSIFNLFPPGNKEDKWYSPDMAAEEYSGMDSVFIEEGFRQLLNSVKRQDFRESYEILETIDDFQKKYGGNILPDPLKKKVEILYNEVNPFERIFPFYLGAGFLLLSILFINIFRMKQLHIAVKKMFFIFISLIFLIHTAGLIARWYISGHAPWSNGYESMVYVAWAAMLAGIIFGRKYSMVIGTASLLSGISLFVAHLNWMNPEITNLVPVLKSHWLTFHVSVITSSYGFLGLSAFLGILVLVLIVIRNDTNKYSVNIFIGQLTTINEMSAIIGLYCLTIGSFLGAVWANESWGRYWGWDPKETWSLITVVVYSFIVHMRLIPSLKGIFNYNLASVVGFGSVIMTYFGVNYYLSGLHSYGRGTTSGLNPAVPVILLLLIALMIAAYFKDIKPKNN